MRITTILPVAFLLVSATSFGQFKKGSTLLGGDVSFSTSKSENRVTAFKNESQAFIFSPVFAKAIQDNLFFGGSLGFGSSKSTFNNGETKSKTYQANLFVRKYKPVFGKLNAFLQGGISVGRDITETEQGPNYYQKTVGFTTSASLTPGISIAVSKKLFLESGFNNLLSISYNSEKTTGSNFSNNIDSKSSSFGFSSSLSTASAGLFFGVRFILPR